MKRVFGLLMIVIMLISTTGYAKSDYQIAQELIYGKWIAQDSRSIMHEFNADNVKIHEVIEVNPMGESCIKVSLKNNETGEWITWSTMLVITLENNRYEMSIVKRRANGNVVLDGDESRIYVKVY